MNLDEPAAGPIVGHESAPFRRVLSLWALVLFGLAFVGPTAPFTFFGVGSQTSHGHFALVYFIAMIAVSFTAISYGRMSAAFPEAGSAYAYAGRALHPVVGFFAGWVMLLDYILIPLLCVIIISANLAALVPVLPYSVCVLFSAALITAINLRGIETTSHVTLIFNCVLAAAVTWFIVAAVHFLVFRRSLSAIVPVQAFYNPKTLRLSAIMAATPIAVLSFLGFDAISTLAEDAKDPQKNVGRATLLVCLIAGSLFILLSWLGQLIWPDYTHFVHAETAFAEIGRLIGGRHLYYLIEALVIAQAWASAITSQASASRLLFAMSRDGRLPNRLFGYVHPIRHTPIYTLLFIGAIAAGGAMLMNLEKAAQLVNFGACLGFMAVNLAVFNLYFVRRRRRRGMEFFKNLVAPYFGFLICFCIWLSISEEAMVIGICWSALGVLYYFAGRGKVKVGGQVAIEG